jgi:hypothetical protein
MKNPDSDVLDVLGIPDIPLHSFFIVKGEVVDLIGFVTPEFGSRWVVMRDPELAARCRSYLERCKTRTFRSAQELAETARLEQWPQWEQHFSRLAEQDLSANRVIDR